MAEEENHLNANNFNSELETLDQTDYYALLNVPRDASMEDIKAAYRRWCLLFHPDKQSDEEKKKMAEKQFISIQKAYNGKFHYWIT
jgi:DnaJ family protein C protein 11